jgi:hypothetical protein
MRAAGRSAMLNPSMKVVGRTRGLNSLAAAAATANFRQGREYVQRLHLDPGPPALLPGPGRIGRIFTGWADHAAGMTR